MIKFPKRLKGFFKCTSIQTLIVNWKKCWFSENIHIVGYRYNFKYSIKIKWILIQ